MSKSSLGRSGEKRAKISTSWEPVAGWYSGWVGKRGSIYHRKVAIPTILRLAEIRPEQRVLDVGCGTGVLAPRVLAAGASYLGVDASRRLLAKARALHGSEPAFELGDARSLLDVRGVREESFDLAVFMLSLQDMDPLDEVVSSVSRTLKPSGSLVVFMTHPCFRVPRGSGWGYDRSRKLTYRRVDSYLSEAAVPMKAYAEVAAQARGTTRSFHRPLASYVNALWRHGLMMNRLEELADPLRPDGSRPRSSEIPLFAAIRASKTGPAE